MSDNVNISGIRLAAGAAGIKSIGNDVVLLECTENTQAAAVFTQNRFCAAPVQIARQHLSTAMPRYLLINSGNANAGTGEAGYEVAMQTCEAVAQQFGCATEAVLPFSTGVIGQLLPADKIIQALPDLQSSLSAEAWPQAAEGIMTTDTVPKLASRQIELAGKTVTITGMAKGAGMVKPNMATVLVYVATDACIAQPCLQAMIQMANAQSFNRITVDGDTSTNDAAVLLATGQAGNVLIEDVNSDAAQIVLAVLTELMIELAQGLVRDAEGATKFVTLHVQGGLSEEDCLAVAYTIAHSPLVKTALFASDANWGRLLAAIGRADIEQLDIEKVSIKINDVLIVEQGAIAASYTEAQGQAAMQPADITIQIDLGAGDAGTTVWTSDLSYDYVRINAEYRT